MKINNEKRVRNEINYVEVIENEEIRNLHGKYI